MTSQTLSASNVFENGLNVDAGGVGLTGLVSGVAADSATLMPPANPEQVASINTVFVGRASVGGSRSRSTSAPGSSTPEYQAPSAADAPALSPGATPNWLAQQSSQPRSAHAHESAIASGNNRTGWEGRSLGEYQIGHVLGCGGNGAVYAGLHRWLERPVAIKFLHDVQAHNAHAVERFRREAQVAAQLIHPGIVRATDGGTVGDQVFLVTDYVDGMDLSAVVRQAVQSGRAKCGLSVADACEIIIQASHALNFISSRGIVHRDIKPSNMMLDCDGNVRILDLGLARIQEHGHTVTATGQVMGTIDYMAPEQASDPRRVNHLADIYSLGCTLYFLLTGRPPLDTSANETLASKLMAILEREPSPIREWRRDLPSKLVKLIERMIDKEPSRRPQTYAQIATELHPFARTANLRSLISSLDKTTVGNQQTLVASTERSTLEGWSDRLLRYVAIKFAVAVGFMDAVPGSRPGQRKRYQFSFRWVRTLIIIAVVLFFFSMIDIEVVPPPNQPMQ